jgi:hypothetical protein
MSGLPSSALSGTFSRWKKREKADCFCLLPFLLMGEGGRRPDEGQRAPLEDQS